MFCQETRQWAIKLVQLVVWAIAFSAAIGWAHLGTYLSRRYPIVDHYLGQDKRLLVSVIVVFTVVSIQT